MKTFDKAIDAQGSTLSNAYCEAKYISPINIDVGRSSARFEKNSRHYIGYWAIGLHSNSGTMG
jgi:hypothetical protein